MITSVPIPQSVESRYRPMYDRCDVCGVLFIARGEDYVDLSLNPLVTWDCCRRCQEALPKVFEDAVYGRGT